MVIHKRYFNFVFLVLFVVIIAIIPWPLIFKNIYGYGFVDREVYENYILYEESILNYTEFNGILDYFKNEFLWHTVIEYMAHGLGVQTENIFLFISVLCIFIFGLIVISKHSPFFLLLLVNPLVIDFAFSQLRLAFSISLLGIAYLLKDKHKYAALIFSIFCLLFHTASFIFLFIWVVIKLLNNLSTQFQTRSFVLFLFLCILGFVISILIGPLRGSILLAIGDRRAEYSDMASSIKYSLFWILLLPIIGIRSKSFFIVDCHRYSIVILSVVAMNVVHGGYSTRFLAATFPFLISTIINLSNKYIIVIYLFIFYTILQWLYWLKII